MGDQPVRIFNTYRCKVKSQNLFLTAGLNWNSPKKTGKLGQSPKRVEGWRGRIFGKWLTKNHLFSLVAFLILSPLWVNKIGQNAPKLPQFCCPFSGLSFWSLLYSMGSSAGKTLPLRWHRYYFPPFPQFLFGTICLLPATMGSSLVVTVAITAWWFSQHWDDHGFTTSRRW